MSDYISREAAEKVFSQPVTMSMCLTLEECKMKNAQRQIDLFVIRGLPAADVRPVVACCDCKHFQVNVSPSGYLPQGVSEWECRYWCRPTDPTDFCSYGEKREES